MNLYFESMNKSIRNLVYRQVPDSMIFEYFGCLKLSSIINKPIYPWMDIPNHLKTQCNFPKIDKGCDGSTLDFKHLLQVKYYKKKSISYKSLSTFLAFEKFSTIKDNNLYLFRLKDTKLTSDINNMIKIGNIIDISITDKEFEESIKEILK